MAGVNALDLSTRLTPTTAATLKQNGVTHVGRYLSTAYKGLTADEVTAIKAAGLQIFSIYEKGATDAAHFNEQYGHIDTADAINLAKAIGQPEGSAIYFTVDYDAPAADFPKILEYFQVVHIHLTNYKVGIYGKYDVLVYLQDKGVGDYFYQTYAWSRNQHATFNNIFQYQNDKTYLGLNVDFDNLEKSDVGAWGQGIKQQVTGPATPVIREIGTVRVKDNIVLNIRKGPGASEPVIGKINTTVVSNPNTFKTYQDVQGWYNVGAGWISGNYCTFKPL